MHAPLRLTKLAPKATLDKLIIPLRPTDSKLTALQPAAAEGAAATPDRERLPRGRVMHRLLLTYKLTLAEGGAITPVLPPLRYAVYDGALEGQVYAVYDSNKKRLSFGDVYPKEVTVPKGATPARAARRHARCSFVQCIPFAPPIVSSRPPGLWPDSPGVGPCLQYRERLCTGGHCMSRCGRDLRNRSQK